MRQIHLALEPPDSNVHAMISTEPVPTNPGQTSAPRSDSTRWDGLGRFSARHIGPRASDIASMVEQLGCADLDDLIDATVPAGIRLCRPLDLPSARTESSALSELAGMAARNEIWRSYLGMGYHDCLTPPVIQRNLLENPGWYTQYTPYQAEISQGRLEGLLTFQTLITDLTGLPVANASLLDEATAAAEAMTMCHGIKQAEAAPDFSFRTDVILRTSSCSAPGRCRWGSRSWSARRRLRVRWHGVRRAGSVPGYLRRHRRLASFIEGRTCRGCAGGGGGGSAEPDAPDATGRVWGGCRRGQRAAIWGSAGLRRARMPLTFATRDAFKRHIPGRLVGVSKDARGRPALRLTLQTREQHIRREKATSNICTAQALLANMAAMYAVYHGPDGLRAIAEKAHRMTSTLAEGLCRLGCAVGDQPFFDTLRVELEPGARAELLRMAQAHRINLRVIGGECWHQPR
jgi:glycine dehydrogenase